MLHIVTDGAADMPPEWVDQYEIHVIPINIQFGDQTYLQGVDISEAGFYRLVSESGKVPGTAQPSPFQFTQFYEKIAAEGDTILSLHVTRKLSGTYEAAVAAARELARKFNVVPFDSGAGSAALGMMCREARLMQRSGAPVAQIVEYLFRVRKRLQIVLTLDTLDYARMSGRVGLLQASLASLLDVKPIVVLRNGLLEMEERVRTRSRSIERVLEIVHQRFDRELLDAAVVHACDPDTAAILHKQAESSLNLRNLYTTSLSISVAANLGPGTVGLVAYPVGV